MRRRLILVKHKLTKARGKIKKNQTIGYLVTCRGIIPTSGRGQSTLASSKGIVPASGGGQGSP